MEVKPEPLLEMTKEERAWVGRFLRDKIMGDRFNLISILLRVQAGKRQVEFYRCHAPANTFCPVTSYEYSEGSAVGVSGCADPRHNWTPADWLAEVEREVKGE